MHAREDTGIPASETPIIDLAAKLSLWGEKQGYSDKILCNVRLRVCARAREGVSERFLACLARLEHGL